MSDDRDQSLDGALSQIENAILPSIATLLDTLLEAAVLGRPGIDADAHAQELRALAAQVESLTRHYAETAKSAAGRPRLYAVTSAA